MRPKLRVNESLENNSRASLSLDQLICNFEQENKDKISVGWSHTIHARTKSDLI